MREILFRGKRIDNGEWVYGDFAIIYNNIVKHLVLLETIGQYTGLTDKNGKRIFAGDVVVISNQRNYPTLVKFCEFCWHLVIPNSYTYIDFGHRLENNPTKYEVIGNIHDNPELLRGGAI